jgi:hypothetical protein
LGDKARAVEEVRRAFDLVVSLDGAPPDAAASDSGIFHNQNQQQQQQQQKQGVLMLSAWERHVLSSAAAAPSTEGGDFDQQPTRSRDGPDGLQDAAAADVDHDSSSPRCILRRHILSACLLAEPSISTPALFLLRRYFKLLRGAQHHRGAIAEGGGRGGLEHEGGDGAALPAQEMLALLLRISTACARLCLRVEAGPEDALVAIAAAEQSNALRFGFAAFAVPPASEDMFSSDSLEELRSVILGDIATTGISDGNIAGPINANGDGDNCDMLVDDSILPHVFHSV